MDPKLVPILEIELEGSFRNKDINLDDNPFFQVAIYGSEADADHAESDGDLPGASINVSRELFISLAKVR
jgi:hypothetical protein